MDNYRKNSVKLLPLITNKDNKIVLHTKYDSFYELYDDIYIVIIDEQTREYVFLDSVRNKKKYTIIGKKGNEITLDANYQDFFNFSGTKVKRSGRSRFNNDDPTNEYIIISNNPNNTNTQMELTSDCYVTKILIKNSKINKGTINNTIIDNTLIEPISPNNIEWKQGIILSSPKEILNVNFDSKYNEDYLILTSIYENDTIENFYTKKDENYGLNFINDAKKAYVNITNCNVNTGVFYNCVFNTEGHNRYEFNNTMINKSIINGKYTINGGYFYNSVFISSNTIWKYGIWENNDSDKFTLHTWEDGIWVNGILNENTKWLKGIFQNGEFNDSKWYNGDFNGGIMNGSEWYNGVFNNGSIKTSTWYNGVFNNGTMNDSTWLNGVFNNGTIEYSTWKNGEFYNGTFKGDPGSSIWKNGKFYNGTMVTSTWEDGEFYNGVMNECNWGKGKWFDGVFKNRSKWNEGEVYNGSFQNSTFEDGIVYYGIFDDMEWKDGTFYNGIMNNSKIFDIKWYNGITNNSIFGDNFGSIIKWYDGSFNSGTFGFRGQYDTDTNNDFTVAQNIKWKNGIFYEGNFYGSEWVKGIMYLGEDPDNTVDVSFKLNKMFEPYDT